MMNKRISRLEFLYGSARTGLFMGMFGVGAAALHGSRTVSECMNTGFCEACNSYGGCSLPEKKDLAQNTPHPRQHQHGQQPGSPLPKNQGKDVDRERNQKV